MVCQVCHYTPALDLAQLGPLAGPEGTIANGRNQLAHPSNSSVMHNHHGAVRRPVPADAAAEPDGRRHHHQPGCASGAARGDLLPVPSGHQRPVPARRHVQRRHAVQRLPRRHGAGGQRLLGRRLAEQPGGLRAGSGQLLRPHQQSAARALGQRAGLRFLPYRDGDRQPGRERSTPSSIPDIDGNVDGIRLRQAFRTDDAKATPIVPTNKRFAEPAVPASFNGFANPGAGNPQLYRVSTGHGGVMCEGCHGATHAEWPNGNPNANDNVTAGQLQGHTGTIIECSTCHQRQQPEPRRFQQEPAGAARLARGGDTNFARGRHESARRTATRTSAAPATARMARVPCSRAWPPTGYWSARRTPRSARMATARCSPRDMRSAASSATITSCNSRSAPGGKDAAQSNPNLGPAGKPRGAFSCLFGALLCMYGSCPPRRAGGHCTGATRRRASQGFGGRQQMQARPIRHRCSRRDLIGSRPWAPIQMTEHRESTTRTCAS